MIPDSLRLARQTFRWYFSGKRDLKPPPGFIKRHMLRRLSQKHGLRVFIETGTYQGATVAALRNTFNRIHTIELSPDLFRSARDKFSHDMHITVHLGDSTQILPQILESLRSPALFWLDAHYSEGSTAHGKKVTPLHEELRAILTHPIAGHVIAIDDVCDLGTGDYPTIDDIQTEAGLAGVNKIRIENNMLILEKTAGRHSGEVELIDRLFHAVGIANHECIEFGAWDGLRGSNTAHLWRTGSWKGLLIEADGSRYELLRANAANFNTVTVHAHVTPTGIHSIDALAHKHEFGPETDLLSIDIDGNDYWIFKSLEYLKPRIVICEYNPTIPPDRIMVGTIDSRIGCSAASLIDLAESRGYILCGATQSNLFFTRKEFLPQLTAASVLTGTDVTIPTDNLCYVISDYDGNYSFSRKPSYGIRAPQQHNTEMSDLDLAVPHRGLATIISAYQNIRMKVYHYLKRIF